jgi:transposase
MLEMVNALTAEDWHMFKAMREQGMSISMATWKTGVSRKTVRKYIAMEKLRKYSP